jgi:cytochrome c551/c552
MPSVGKSKCGACRAIDHKVVGPAFMDVSAKYKGEMTQLEQLPQVSKKAVPLVEN